MGVFSVFSLNFIIAMSVVHKNLEELMKELFEFDSPGEGVVDEMEYRVFRAVLARDTVSSGFGLYCCVRC